VEPAALNVTDNPFSVTVKAAVGGVFAGGAVTVTLRVVVAVAPASSVAVSVIV
jgi:hypothetical protein